MTIQSLRQEFQNGFDKGFRDGVQYAMDYLAEVYGLDDIEDTHLFAEFGETPVDQDGEDEGS